MLTESQKNYVQMLLMGGPLPESELRIFLAKSGWGIDAIDAGVNYSKTSELADTIKIIQTAEVNPELETLNTPEIRPEPAKTLEVKSESLEASVTPESTAATVTSSNAFEVTNKDVQKLNASLSNLDGLSAYHSDTTATKTSTKPTLTDVTYPSAAPMSVMASNEQTRVESAHSSKALSVVIWILVVVLILAILAVSAYMFSTDSGLFQNISYVKG
jgi:hypothetical protein